MPEREFCFTTKEGFASIKSTYEEFTAPEPEGHPQVLESFAQSILNGTEMHIRAAFKDEYKEKEK